MPTTAPALGAVSSPPMIRVGVIIGIVLGVVVLIFATSLLVFCVLGIPFPSPLKKSFVWSKSRHSTGPGFIDNTTSAVISDIAFASRQEESRITAHDRDILAKELKHQPSDSTLRFTSWNPTVSGEESFLPDLKGRTYGFAKAYMSPYKQYSSGWRGVV